MTSKPVFSNLLIILTAIGFLLFTNTNKTIDNEEIIVQNIDPSPSMFSIGSPYKIKGVTYYPEYDPTYKKIGISSWYGPGFDGKIAAGGEVFNTNRLTAAHPTLPINSRVWVTNLATHKKVLVTITDRGPFVDGRIIDLSRASAKAIGVYESGLARVKVEYDSKETERYLKSKGLYKQYLRQIKSYKVASN